MVTKHWSRNPFAVCVLRASCKNASVAMVTVGMPLLSRLSWSTTSHEVQLPQSHWEPMTRSGLRAERTFALRWDSLSVPETPLSEVSDLYVRMIFAVG